MAVSPDTEIRLLKVPIELDNKNQLTFANKEAQYNYFNSLPKIVGDNFTYQRKDSIVRFPAHIDSILTFNYCMYQNEHYSDKWFYCFITDKKYINDNMTELTIKTDVFQTWQFDLQYKKCFVEREHVSNDTIGLHTVPENLEIGDYIENTALNRYLFDDYVFLIQVTKFYHTSTLPAAINIGGNLQAGGFYACDTASDFVDVIDEYNDPSNGVSPENIVNAYIVPKDILTGLIDTNNQWHGQTNALSWNYTLNKPSSLDGYIPKNKKLLTYPYIALVLSNNAGVSNTLRYEEFSTSDCEFEIKGTPSVGASIKCSPIHYKNYANAYEEEGIICAKFPTLSWSQDNYTNWIVQNGVNLSVGLATDIGTSIGGALAGSPGTALNGLMGIINKMAQVEQQKFTPNSARGNTNGGDIQSSSKTIGFYFYNLSIKAEYAKIVDDFFSMFGYKVNTVKVPNITGRTNWNYVKTIDSIIIGDVPQNDLQEIKNMFDDGVTLWHNSNTFLDYSQSNNIV